MVLARERPALYGVARRRPRSTQGGDHQWSGKRIQFDDETWEALSAVARDKGVTFQEIADEAFADLLKKHKQPVGLMASLKESRWPQKARAPLTPRTPPGVGKRDVDAPLLHIAFRWPCQL